MKLCRIDITRMFQIVIEPDTRGSGAPTPLDDARWKELGMAVVAKEDTEP